eukprot:8046127-Alexandrium_andersonii.AAC.1
MPRHPARSASDPSVVDDLSLDAAGMDHLNKHLKLHYLPPVGLASGGTKHADKFHAAMHTLYLEA